MGPNFRYTVDQWTSVMFGQCSTEEQGSCPVKTRLTTVTACQRYSKVKILAISGEWVVRALRQTLVLADGHKRATNDCAVGQANSAFKVKGSKYKHDIHT